MNRTQGWIPARVGCHWTHPRYPKAVISTFSRGNPAPGQMRSGYGAWINYVLLGEYETLALAQQAVEQDEASLERSQRERSKSDKLAAAAPELLEACKLFQAALTEYRLRDVKKRFSLCLADAAASKAIAQAEGRA